MAHKHVKLTRRPIPNDGIGWRNEIRGVVSFLNKRFDIKDGTAGHWHRNISEYYLDRLTDLIKMAPHHLRGTPELREWREKVEQCRQRYTSRAS